MLAPGASVSPCCPPCSCGVAVEGMPAVPCAAASVEFGGGQSSASHLLLSFNELAHTGRAVLSGCLLALLK